MAPLRQWRTVKNRNTEVGALQRAPLVLFKCCVTQRLQILVQEYPMQSQEGRMPSSDTYMRLICTFVNSLRKVMRLY